MMTKSKKFLMLMLTLVVSVAGYAKTEIDGIYYNLNSKTKEAEVVYGKNSEEVTIPSNVTYDGIKYNVTSIGERAFLGYNNLVSVKIPNSVTNIGEAAFLSCGKLSSVTLPNSIKSIGRATFQMTRITSITIPKSVTSIGNYAFDMCGALTSVTMGNSVKSIGCRAFSYTGLTSITTFESLFSNTC